MKKILKLLIIISSFFIFNDVNAAYDNDFDFGYIIENYDVDMIVNENNSFDITEKITVYFNEDRHGIIRNIPLKNEIKRLDGSSSKNKAKISNININEKYSKSKENGKLKLKIGSANKTLTGKKEYIIKYNYRLSNDKEKNFDEIYFNIIGNEWDTIINNVTFKIHMPKDFDESKLGFATGSYGSTDNDLIDYEIKNNVIEGKYTGMLNPGEGITVRCQLEEGYFQIPLIDKIMDNLVFIIPGILTLVCLILLLSKGIDKHVIETVEFNAPNGFNSLDVAYIYKGKINNKDIMSLLIYLASKGYIEIIENEKKDIKFKKLKDYDGDDESEKNFLEGMFKNDDVTKPSRLKNKFYRTIEQIKKEKRNDNFSTSIFDSKNKKYTIAIIINMILSVIFSIGLSVYNNAGVEEVIIAVFLLVFYSIFFIVGFAAKGNTIFQVFWLGFTTMHFMIMGGAFVFQYIDNKLVVLFELICLLIMAFCLKYIPKRTEYGSEMYGKIKGFKRFLTTAEKEKLEEMVSSNPSYFYDILPYVYVLGITDKWIKQFENITLAEPSWYSGTNFSYHTMDHFMNETMNSLNKTMGSVPASTGGGSSSGGSSSSSGGGFSGGGSGGGGGSSW